MSNEGEETGDKSVMQRRKGGARRHEGREGDVE